MFIIVDGIDGSGKSTVLAAWKESLVAEGNGVFDLSEYWHTHGRHPELSELKSYDFIISGEPTRVGVGAAIRQELVNKNYSYPPLSIAQAYALDRLILYTKLILPLLQQDKCVLQDRGITTTLCYQPLMHPELTPEFLATLEGNALALRQRPDHAVLVACPPEKAMARLSARGEKQDNVIFEELNFAKRAAARFVSPEYRELLTSRGTHLHELSGETEIGIMKQEAVALLGRLLT